MPEIDWDNLPETTVPPMTVVSVRDFTNEEAGRRLGEKVAGIVKTVGSIMDLSRLDGVTVAIDYDAALAALDRGMDGLRPLARSNTEEMQGVAMSPAVVRDGEVRTHLIFNAEMLVPLIADDSEVDAGDRALSLGIIAHECAHVLITAEKERAIPEARLGTRIEGYERALMFQLAEVCWDEYAACRLSSPLAVGQGATHADTVVACTQVARGRSDEAIRAYRLHRDLDRLMSEAGPALVHPIKAAAYLLGGMDAVGAQWSDFPSVRETLEEHGYDDLVDRLRAELGRLWDTREEWDPTLATFEGLEDIARETFPIRRDRVLDVKLRPVPHRCPVHRVDHALSVARRRGPSGAPSSPRKAARPTQLFDAAGPVIAGRLRAPSGRRASAGSGSHPPLSFSPVTTRPPQRAGPGRSACAAW